MNDSVIEAGDTDAEILEGGLECVAETLGDIIPLVVERYYRQYPEGRSSFLHHGFEGHERLASSMVDTTLYCIMGWVTNRREIEAIISDTVPHHRSIKIPDTLLVSLLNVTLEVLLSGIPVQQRAARDLLESVVGEIQSAIEQA